VSGQKRNLVWQGGIREVIGRNVKVGGTEGRTEGGREGRREELGCGVWMGFSSSSLSLSPTHHGTSLSLYTHTTLLQVHRSLTSG
jgi:hypothetical protein